MEYTKQELEAARNVVRNTINRCENMRPKFRSDTAQYSLLENRLRALYTAQKLLTGKGGDFSKKELEAALPPIASILHKTETARRKHPEDSPIDRRLSPTIRAMEIVRELLEQALSQIREA